MGPLSDHLSNGGDERTVESTGDSRSRLYRSLDDPERSSLSPPPQNATDDEGVPTFSILLGLYAARSVMLFVCFSTFYFFFYFTLLPRLLLYGRSELENLLLKTETVKAAVLSEVEQLKVSRFGVSSSFVSTSIVPAIHSLLGAPLIASWNSQPASQPALPTQTR